jgi:hypothetical protein
VRPAGEPCGPFDRLTGMTDQVVYAMGGVALLMTAMILISLSQMI